MSFVIVLLAAALASSLLGASDQTPPPAQPAAPATPAPAAQAPAAPATPFQVTTSGQSKVGYFEAHEDVGKPAIAGTTVYDPKAQTYTITGAGVNMWAKRDEFQFAWRKLSGDFIVRTHAAFLGKGVDPHRKLGWICASRWTRGIAGRRRRQLPRSERARRTRPDGHDEVEVVLVEAPEHVAGGVRRILLRRSRGYLGEDVTPSILARGRKLLLNPLVTVQPLARDALQGVTFVRVGVENRQLRFTMAEHDPGAGFRVDNHRVGVGGDRVPPGSPGGAQWRARRYSLALADLSRVPSGNRPKCFMKYPMGIGVQYQDPGHASGPEPRHLTISKNLSEATRAKSMAAIGRSGGTAAGISAADFGASILDTRS